MNKQQAWDEWHKGILGNKAPDINLSSHGKAFSAGWDAALKQTAADFEALRQQSRKTYEKEMEELKNQTPIRKDMDAPGMY